MATLHNEISIAADPDAVWRIVGDLEATPEWIPGVVSADVDGDLRRCRTADGAEIEERILEASEATRTIRYAQIRVPLPIAGSRGTLRVLAHGSGSRVEWDAQFEAPEEVAAMVDGYYSQTLEALKRRVETGKRPA